MKYDIYLSVTGENPCDPSVGMEIQPPLETTAEGFSAALGEWLLGARVRVNRNDNEGTAFAVGPSDAHLLVDLYAESVRKLSPEQLGRYVFDAAKNLIDPCSLHTVKFHLKKIEQ